MSEMSGSVEVTTGLKKFKWPILFNAALLIMFTAMGGATGIRLFLVFFLLYFFPGYFVLHKFGFTETEKLALGIPVSFSFTILFFFISRLGVRSINAWGIIFLYLLLLVLHFRTKIRLS